MRRLSLKTRLVLLHTGLMTLVVCLALGVLLLASSQQISANAQRVLEERVGSAAEDVAFENGRLEFDRELLSLENGVYLSVYGPGEGELLYGRLPYGFAYGLSLEPGRLRTVTAGDAQFTVLDMAFPVEGYGELVVRGVLSLTEAEGDLRFTLRLALALAPAVLGLTALCGYLLSRRALGPVARITQTVRRIQKERDLSRRVRLGPGRDEIYTLGETFDSLLDQVEEGFAREKQFTSDVAHELRTPLTVILMQCESLLAREDLPPQARQEVEVVARKARSMAEMASQLLLLSRADQGRAQLSLEELDLSELSQMQADEFAGAARQKGFCFSADIQPGVRAVADQTLVLRLWGNLLQNALTYGREGGSIRMALEKQGGWAALTVEDDGPGIAPEHLPRLWDRFYQADPARSAGGSGLGLSMVQWIAQAHGGQARVESQVGKGSRFTVELPLAGPQEAQKKRP